MNNSYHISLFDPDALSKLREADNALARKETRLKSALEAISERRAAISEKIDKVEDLLRDIDELIDGVLDNDDENLVGVHAVKKPHGANTNKVAPRVEKGSWTSTIKKLTYDADRPLKYDELRDMIMETDLAPKMQKTDKSFYGAIGRLANNKEVVKKSGYVFSPSAYEKYRADLAAGRVQELPKAHPGQASPTADEIFAYLRNREYGATSAEIIEHLRSTDLRDQIEKNKTFAYNVLSRLKARGELVKEGTHYCLPQNIEGPAVAEPSTDGVNFSNSDQNTETSINDLLG